MIYHHDETGQFHHKYAIIDAYFNEIGSPMVINGSYNWSASAEEKNDENTIIWHSFNMANLFMQEFSARWGESATSTIDLDSKMNVSVFPVPFMEHLTIETEYSGQTQLTIYDAMGRIMNKQVLRDSINNINTADWKAGIYVLDFLDLSTADRNSIKIIKN